MKNKLWLWAIGAVLLSSCASNKLTHNNIPQIKFLNEIDIPYEENFQNTELGGFSGIDYDEKNKEYYIISDDRSEHAPARFYKAKIDIKNDKLNNFKITKVEYLKNKNGQFFGNFRENSKLSIDPEDIRYNPEAHKIYWTNEGERLMKGGDTLIMQPSLWEANLDGSFSKEFQLPKELIMSSKESGPRRNGVLEGLTFNANFSKIYTQVEEPLYEDGPRATTKEGGKIRLFEFDSKTLKNTAQYFYELDPVAKTPIPEDAFAVNGVSAILQYGDGFIFVERSYSTGSQQCTIKLYYQKYTPSNNILLKNHQENAPKILIANLDDLGIDIDNIEGITVGPQLGNGKKSLLLISDNNFSSKQKTQLLLFELSE